MIERDKYVSKVDYVMQLVRKEVFVWVGFFGVIGFFGNLIVFFVLYKGGLLMGSVYMIVGEFFFFLMYVFWVGISIGGLSFFYLELMKGLGVGGCFWEFLEREFKLFFNEGVILSDKSFQGVLEFKNVYFVYLVCLEVFIFQDFSFFILLGFVMVLVGLSGLGKLIVFLFLLRLYDFVFGIISFDGYDICQLNLVWLRFKIGIVSQEFILFFCLIVENIVYGVDDFFFVIVGEVQRVVEVVNVVVFIWNFF